MLRSPFRVQTSFRSPHSPPVASPSAVPDLPKLRVLGSSLSRWQIPVFCTDTQGPIFSAMFPIPPWHVVFPLSEHLWSTEAQIGYLLLAHPHLLCKSEKLKAMLNQNSETRLWTSIRILFNFLKFCHFPINDSSRNKNYSYEWTIIKTIHSTYSNNNSIKTWASSLKSSNKSMLKLRKLIINVYICMYIIHIYTHNILSNKKQWKIVHILNLWKKVIFPKEIMKDTDKTALIR